MDNENVRRIRAGDEIPGSVGMPSHPQVGGQRPMAKKER